MNLKIETDVLNICKELDAIHSTGETFMFEGEAFQPTRATIAFDGLKHSITAEFVRIPREVAPLDMAIQVIEGAAMKFVVAEAKRMLADPADELGKVWDVLHAAGINSGGELSASEGVKLLADKVVQIKVLLNSNYGPGGIGRFVPDEPKPMCDHDWMYVGALSKMCCTKCEATRSKE